MSTHDHDQDHDHDAHNAPESGPALRVKALEALLTEKGIVNAQKGSSTRRRSMNW